MDPFVHLPEHPFIVCQRCKVGLPVSEVTTHVRRHGDISRGDASRINELVKSIPGIIQDQAGMQQWSPPPGVQPIPHIEPPMQDGFGCNTCPYVVREIRQIQKHCRNEHSWVNDWKKGGNVVQRAQQQRSVPWRSGVRCQRVAKHGHGNRWFEVRQDEDEAVANGNQQARDEAAAFINRIHREDEDAFESEAKAKIQDIDDKWEAQAWLRRCGWPRHLEGIDRGRLCETARPIGDDEPVLARMWEIFERVLNKAYAMATQCHPGSAELFEIERKEVHITTNKPFEGLMEPDAWERYKAWWRTLMSIWKRYEGWERGGVRGSEGGSESESEGSSGSGSESGSSGSGSESGSSEDTKSSTNPPRPKYRMTTAQERMWNKFDEGVTGAVAGAPGHPSDEQLEQSCLDAVVQFFDHPLKNGNHYESIVISALAVMGVDEHGRWVPATNYTPIYSAVIKVARYLVLYQSVLEREARIRVRQQGMPIDRRTAEEQVEGLFRIIRRKVRRFMTRISDDKDADPTPMNWIINTRTYGMRIRYTTPGSETIDWRGDQIIHGRVKLRMGELSDMLHNLVAEARRTLEQLTMTDGSGGIDSSTALPRIPWARIQDQHGESELEYSFLRHEENQWWTEAGRGWVKDRMLASTSRRTAWLAGSDERCPYREQAVREYGRAVERFRGQLFMAMHMTGGQPARSSEILGLRMWNTANAGVRNIFIHEGMVCFVTMYHKGFRKTGNTKIIHRYLPREVGELLVWYMWLALPFWQNIQGRVKQKRRRSAFLWADEVVGDDGGKERKMMEAKHDTGDEEAAFMEWFRERKWTGDRARRVMQQYSAQFSGQELNISAWRQMAIGISNRFFNKVFGDEGDGGGDEDDDKGLVDSIFDLQAGHGSHVAGLIYARLFGQGELGTMRSREQFRKVSMQWHRFFGFGAEDRTEHSYGKRARAAFDAERETMQRNRFNRLRRIDIRGQLKQMIGPTAEFRGRQEEVIREVSRGAWPIVQVTPTGGGKSLTFMLPAFCTPDGVTVVITPLVSLQDDMAARCAKMGISAYVWTSRGVQRAAPLVFVTPESAVSKGFRAFVERMHGQQKLDRVVVDECHTLLQYSKTFRPQTAWLGQTLQDFGVPVICLTATLKPSQEKALYGELHFTSDQVQMFREATTRPNIQYRVEVVEDGQRSGGTANIGRKRVGKVRVNQNGEEEGEEDDAVADRACHIVRRWTEAHPQGKVVIYGGTIQRVEQIAAMLGCGAYWRGAGSKEEKTRQMEEWRSSQGGTTGWIAATNALGMGIDDPGVRMVVHAGMPRQLVDFVQESGRGGRDGRKSESVVVIRRSWLRQQAEAGTARSGQDEWAWDEDAVEFAEGKRCRREVLDREMDGNMDRFGCIGGEEACDVCQGQQMARDMDELAEGVRWDIEEDEAEVAVDADYQQSQRMTQQVEARRTLQVMGEAQEVGEFEDMLAEWAGCCAVCKIQGSREAYHVAEECPGKDGIWWTDVQEGERRVRDEMMGKGRFARFSGCFGCGLPQAICDKWQAASEDGRLFRKVPGKRCQYPELLIRIFVAQRVRAAEWWMEQVAKMMGVKEIDGQDAGDMGKLYAWIGELVEWGGRGGGIQASRMCQVVTRLNRQWAIRGEFGS